MQVMSTTEGEGGLRELTAEELDSVSGGHVVQAIATSIAGGAAAFGLAVLAGAALKASANGIGR